MRITENQKLKMDEYGIPEYMQGGIIRYYEHGIQPGSFLTAVINNDLREAVGRADDTNVHCLHKYIMWFYNQAPMGSWGFEGATEKWYADFEKGAA